MFYTDLNKTEDCNEQLSLIQTCNGCSSNKTVITFDVLFKRLRVNVLWISESQFNQYLTHALVTHIE